MRILELFVEMGFTIPQAIQIASLNGAKYLEKEATVGTITANKLADLVLIDGDISKNISQIRNIETVFKNGIGYDSKKLFKAAKGLVGVR
jgi:imidazolonepropionase-like amidohydrolase